MDISPGGKVISTILKHDTKQTSYKIALVRAINDVALSFPDSRDYERDVAVPIRFIAAFWLAYYYPFVDPCRPILQGKRARRLGDLSTDMAFRPHLTRFRQLWQDQFAGAVNPADGFYAIHDLRLARNQKTYVPQLLQSYHTALKQIAKVVQMPIRYAGPGGQEWSVFEKPKRYRDVAERVVSVPGTREEDLCLIITNALWQAFRGLSLWIEALCLHEWCIFTSELVQEGGDRLDRGAIYQLLTARPDNRRPLTWERNQIDLLLMEGYEFLCPWTQSTIRNGTSYDLDHILPLAVYPINELWNLVPANPEFNSLHKRDRMPSAISLGRAESCLVRTYSLYIRSVRLGVVLREDVELRFGSLHTEDFPQNIAQSVVNFVHGIAEARNLVQF